MSRRPDRRARRAFVRIWASRWPEGAWTLFAVGNLCWMLLVPSWSMLPYHLTWMSLLLLYGLGIRSWSRLLTWCLVAPVMTATMLIFVDPAIAGRAPYDEVIELPMMAVMLFAISRLTKHRLAAMEKLDAVSQRNVALLKRQREFVQNASHELRTPIAIALAHTELVQRSAGADVAGDVTIVLDELERLQRIVDELLSLAAAERRDPVGQVVTPVAPVVQDVLHRWKAIKRTWSASHVEDAVVQLDPGRLAAALDALLENAVRFTTGGDRIAVSVRRMKDQVVITVGDSGPGFRADELATVFERFSSGSRVVGTDDPSTSPRNVGLGLSIVRAIAEAAGGHVEAGASDLGGAAVTISLPLHTPRPQAEELPATFVSGQLVRVPS